MTSDDEETYVAARVPGDRCSICDRVKGKVAGQCKRQVAQHDWALETWLPRPNQNEPEAERKLRLIKEAAYDECNARRVDWRSRALKAEAERDEWERTTKNWEATAGQRAERVEVELRGELATILAERDAAVSMGTQLERERDKYAEALKLAREALEAGDGLRPNSDYAWKVIKKALGE